MDKFVCPNCGNGRFHEVGSVATTTAVILERLPDGRPRFVDYDPERAGSKTIWDTGEGYYIECSSCLARPENIEDWQDQIEPGDAMNALRAIHRFLWPENYDPAKYADVREHGFFTAGEDEIHEWSADTIDVVGTMTRRALDGDPQTSGERFVPADTEEQQNG